MQPGTEQPFWWWHAVVPAGCFALATVIANAFGLDVALAHAWAYQESGWIGAGTWWAEKLLHDGGRGAIRAIAALCLAAMLLAPTRPWRGVAGYLVVAIACSALLAGTLKHLTNVDCPWDLQGFGGARPYVHAFADRPEELPPAACFPGAHSASGFSLVAFYFAFRDRNRRIARLGLAAGIAAGIAFSLAQQARGAHFLSHDLSSAFLAWFACLALYRAILKPGPIWRAAAGSRNRGSSPPTEPQCAMEGSSRERAAP